MSMRIGGIEPTPPPSRPDVPERGVVAEQFSRALRARREDCVEDDRNVKAQRAAKATRAKNAEQRALVRAERPDSVRAAERGASPVTRDAKAASRRDAGVPDPTSGAVALPAKPGTPTGGVATTGMNEPQPGDKGGWSADETLPGRAPATGALVGQPGERVGADDAVAAAQAGAVLAAELAALTQAQQAAISGVVAEAPAQARESAVAALAAPAQAVAAPAWAAEAPAAGVPLSPQAQTDAALEALRAGAPVAALTATAGSGAPTSPVAAAGPAPAAAPLPASAAPALAQAAAQAPSVPAQGLPASLPGTAAPAGPAQDVPALAAGAVRASALSGAGTLGGRPYAQGATAPAVSGNPAGQGADGVAAGPLGQGLGAVVAEPSSAPPAVDAVVTAVGRSVSAPPSGRAGGHALAFGAVPSGTAEVGSDAVPPVLPLASAEPARSAALRGVVPSPLAAGVPSPADSAATGAAPSGAGAAEPLPASPANPAGEASTRATAMADPGAGTHSAQTAQAAHAGQPAPHVAPSAHVAPGAPATATPPPPVHAQVWSAIAPGLQRRDGSYAVELQLDPASLGRVRISVTMVAGEISVQMQAADAGARDLLRQHSEQLRQQLADSGMTAGVDVSDGSTSWQDPQRQGAFAAEGSAARPGAGPASRDLSAAEPALAPATPTHAAADGGLDLKL